VRSVFTERKPTVSGLTRKSQSNQLFTNFDPPGGVGY